MTAQTVIQFLIFFAVLGAGCWWCYNIYKSAMWGGWKILSMVGIILTGVIATPFVAPFLIDLIGNQLTKADTNAECVKHLDDANRLTQSCFSTIDKVLDLLDGIEPAKATDENLKAISNKLTEASGYAKELLGKLEIASKFINTKVSTTTGEVLSGPRTAAGADKAPPIDSPLTATATRAVNALDATTTASGAAPDKYNSIYKALLTARVCMDSIGIQVRSELKQRSGK